LRDLVKKGIDPIAFRFWLLTSHYRTKTNFTMEAVIGAQNALIRIRKTFLSLGDEIGKVEEKYKNQLIKYMDNDLGTPETLTVLWKLIKDTNISNQNKKATLLDFDKVLGLGLNQLKKEIIPLNIKQLVEEREEVRRNKDWNKSDKLRDQIKNLGYEIKDSSSSTKISKI